MSKAHELSKVFLKGIPPKTDTVNTSMICHYNIDASDCFGGNETIKIIPTSNTLLYYDFHEGSGTVINSFDYSWKAQMYGSPVWSATGLTGNSVALSSANQYIDTGTNMQNIISKYGGFTLEAWVQYNGDPYSSSSGIVFGGNGFIWGILQGYNSSLASYSFSMWQVDGSSNKTCVSVGGTCAKTGWHYIAGTYNDTTKVIALYIDGVLCRTNTLTYSTYFSNPSLIFGTNSTIYYPNVSICRSILSNYSMSSTDITGRNLAANEYMSGLSKFPVTDPISGIACGMLGKYGGCAIVTEPTINLATGIAPWGDGGGTCTDVSATEPGPITNSTTWKFIKTGTAAEWNGWGWEKDYSLFPSANIGDVFTVSGWYKTTSNIIYTITVGSFMSSDQSQYVANETGSYGKTIIADGAWHFFYSSMQFAVACTNPIISGGPAWDYSTSAGTFYINGLQWEKKSYPTYYTYGTRCNYSRYVYPSSVWSSTEGTINLWFKYQSLAAFGSTDPIFSNGHNEADGLAFDLLFGSDSTNGRVYFRAYTSTSTAYQVFYDFTQDMRDQWIMITCTWKNSGNMVLYINGINVSNISCPTLQTWSSFLNIGGGIRSTPNFMIDELKVDKKQQSDEDILSWFVAQAPFYVQDRYKLVR